MAHSYFTEVPDQYLGGVPQGWQDFLAAGTDVEFHLPMADNVQQAFSDISGERLAKVLKNVTSAQAGLTDRQNHSRARRLNVAAPPTRADADQARLDSATYARMYDDGLKADYRPIAQQGRQLQQLLRGARRVRITTPDGTDLSFTMGDRPVIVDAGMPLPGTRGLLAARTAQLPGGSLRLAPVETSVNGTIRAPSDQCEQAVKDEAIDVRSGMPENVHAASDEECVRAALEHAGRFGWVEIGLNSTFRVDDPNVNLASALLDLGAGAVTVDFGTNQELGGANRTAQGGWYIVLPHATVEADGKVIVRDGALGM